ncbi:ribonuclease Z [Stetteria hydrogenophila]
MEARSGRYVEVTVLGSGGGAPTRERWLPAFFVADWMGHGILLDAGEGAQLRLAELGFSVNDIDVVAITHSHGDHVNGLPGILQSMYMNSRRRPLTILADRHTAEFVRDTLAVDRRDLGFEVRVVEVSGVGEYVASVKGGDSLVLKWFPVCHSVEAYGFALEWRLRARLDVGKLERMGLKPGPWVSELLARGEAEAGGRRVRVEDVSTGPRLLRIVYTGDTAPCPSVVENARGARLLIHDSTFDSSLREEAEERRHSTALDAARVAREAGVEYLLLTHVSPRYRGHATVLEREARRVFGNARLAWDRMRLRFTV